MTSATPLDVGAEPGRAYFDPARALTLFGSEQGLRKVLQMALDSLMTDIDRIGSLLDTGALQEANHLLHGIKGFAPLFCGDALTASIADLEGLSKTGPVAQVRVRYGNLRPELVQWRSEIERYLTRKSAAPECGGAQHDSTPRDDAGLNP